MARFFDCLDEPLRRFIEAQPIFFVASATADSRINLSPKGLKDTLAVLDPRRVAYLDLTGSGNETAAHLHHDGRLTLMVCSFDANPRILRLYGRGHVVRPGDPRFAALRLRFATDHPGERQIVVLDIESVQTSCGFAVPRMDLVAERDTLDAWAERKGPAGLAAWRAEKNAVSIDGLAVDPDEPSDR